MRRLLLSALLLAAAAAAQTNPGQLPRTAALEAADPSVLGSNLVTNGGFSADANWTKGAGWTISSNEADWATPGTSNPIYQDLSGVVQNSGLYLLSYQIIRGYGGNCQAGWIGGAQGAIHSASTGTYQDVLVAPANGVRQLGFTCTATQADITNVTLQKINGGNVTARGKYTGGGTLGIKLDESGNATFDQPITETNLVSNTAIGNSPQRICHAQYSFATDGGAVGLLGPVKFCVLPAHAVIFNIGINSTTALTSAGAATVSIGISGVAPANLLAATGIASFSANAFVQGVPVPQTASTWIKLASQTAPTLTIGTAALTAGVIEMYIFYYVSGT